MPVPTFDELKNWAENYPKLWNAGDKQAWVDNWRKVGPGHFRMLDPVGTPEKEGFDVEGIAMSTLLYCLQSLIASGAARTMRSAYSNPPTPKR